MLSDGYADYSTGNFGSYSPEGTYAGTKEYIEIDDSLVYTTTCHFQALAGIAFYDVNKTYLSGYVDNNVSPIKIPDNAKYFRISDYNESGNHDGAKVYATKVGELDKKLSALEQQVTNSFIVINCTGDSVTEGMATNGAHTADYGKSPYPARLYTILKDNGYNNIIVNNYGHGGERLQDVAVRLGGYGCYINDDIIIPSNNTEVSLGTYNTDEHGRITGTKLSLYKQDQFGNDYNVYLTQTSHDTNPCYIDGIEYTMSIHDNANWIKKSVSDGKETAIPNGSLFFTANNRNPNVNIIYIGINGANSLTLEQWIDVNKVCGLVNGGKYIILGCTHPLFKQWSDIEGSSGDEKYEFYKRKCYEAFGTHFIDLYDEFARHAMDIALKAGYFSDKSPEEIENMRTLLANHTIPAEFSYDKNSPGNVHLSEEGYHVIGVLLYERLRQLGYIPK